MTKPVILRRNGLQLLYSRYPYTIRYIMVFVACGLSHKTAPIDVREQIALSAEQQDGLLARCLALPAVNEATLLSTCNRTEIYCDTRDPNGLIPWLANEYQLKPEHISPYFYTHQGHHGVKHTLRVASGLDSMMLGEPQILGQMKQAYQHAERAGGIKKNLHQIFQYVFRASKRIRTQSGVGNKPVSVAFAAVQLVGQRFPDFSSLNVLLVGSGETASLVSKYLREQGVTQFSVASRNPENAQKIVGPTSGNAFPIADIPKHLSTADVVISATACPLPFISKGLVELAMQGRDDKPLFLLDLAVPRDIEPDVGELPHVHLYNIDDLQAMTQEGLRERQTAAEEAESLIDDELEKFLRKHRARQATHLICDYRQQMEHVTQKELQRALKLLSSGQSQEQVVTELSDRLLKKLTHQPTVGLRLAAETNQVDLLTLAQTLFNSQLEDNHYETIA